MDKTWFNMLYNKELDENQIEIYDQIGFWGISASQFITDLKALDNSKKLFGHKVFIITLGSIQRRDFPARK